MTQPRISRGASVRPFGSALSPSIPGDDQLDLTGVDPLRIEEVRRRVAVVKSYIADPLPDEKTRRAHAALLGLSVNQFLALVRAWREHGRAVEISGAGAARGKPRAKVARSLPTASKEAARAVIRSLGHDVPHVEAVRAVNEKCAELNTKAPSRSSIWDMIMELRREAARSVGKQAIIVSKCHVKLPVNYEGAAVFPPIILAVDGRNGTILAAAMGDLEAMGPTIALGLEGRIEEVVIDSDIAAISGFPIDHTKVTPSAARTATAKILGRGFGSIELIYQISRAVDPNGLLRSRMASALREEDAYRVVFENLCTHNASRHAPPAKVSWQH